MTAHLRRLIEELDARLQAVGTPPGLWLPFNGTLSDDEQRMLDQFAFME